METPDGHALSPPMPVHGYVAARGGEAVPAAPVAAAVPVMQVGREIPSGND